ncbi:MAG: class I SAM-dependent methyltransferase [Alphaproteobacteria bacterium]
MTSEINSPASSSASSGQTWSADSYDAHVRFVSELGAGVIDWLGPRAGQRILDLGCGDGALTGEIARSGAHVVGVDQSADFVASARARNLDVRQADGEALTFDGEFDAVFSNAALHWMRDPDAVIAGVARALKPGGRFVGEFGGHGNVAAVATAMRAVGAAMGSEIDYDLRLAAPWYFPSADEYAARLAAGGFTVDRITLFARPTPLPTGMRPWLEIMRAPFFEQFGARSDEAYRRVMSALEPSLCDGTGNWHADYVRLRFEARLAG